MTTPPTTKTTAANTFSLSRLLGISSSIFLAPYFFSFIINFFLQIRIHSFCSSFLFSLSKYIHSFWWVTPRAHTRYELLFELFSRFIWVHLETFPHFWKSSFVEIDKRMFNFLGAGLGYLFFSIFKPNSIKCLSCNTEISYIGVMNFHTHLLRMF